MITPVAEQAINDALRYGNAVLKYISPNDVGITSSHQCGYYLPKNHWRMFTPNEPIKGANNEHLVDILWHNGQMTHSRIVWYGTGTRSEFRLTRFGRDFPFLAADCVGDLLILIRKDSTHFNAYTLDLSEDVEELQAVLGVEIIGTFGYYNRNAQQHDDDETPNECIERKLRAFAGTLSTFPETRIFSGFVQKVLNDCISDFTSQEQDAQLISLIENEYNLFRIAERIICAHDISRIHESVDDFLKTAATLMNRRKSRAGHSLENHVAFLLNNATIPFDAQVREIEGKPDIVIPNKLAYRDSNYPIERLFVVGLKTTCKDRWRQVLNEARRVQHKYILTTQQGISENQLAEMRDSQVSLIVPRAYHRMYPQVEQMEILTVHDFIIKVKRTLPNAAPRDRFFKSYL